MSDSKHMYIQHRKNPNILHKFTQSVDKITPIHCENGLIITQLGSVKSSTKRPRGSFLGGDKLGSLGSPVEGYRLPYWFQFEINEE